MKKTASLLLALLGLSLVAVPVATSMFDRAPKGADMLVGFDPYMTSARLDLYTRHIADLEAGVVESETRIGAALGGRDALAETSPTFVAFRGTWRGIEADMSDMLGTIRDNVDEFAAVQALPSFDLFPWFFVAPGVLLVLAGGALLVRPRAWAGPARWVVVGLGVGLVAAPVAFQMFERAPKGAAMIRAFEDVETRKKVETIQGYFGEIAVGQGAIRLELLPAVAERTGASESAVGREYPAAQALVDRWPDILGDLTPLIGTMSDNVANYDAVRALPDFRLFPWLFVVPGLAVIAAGVLAGRSPRPQEIL